MALGDWFDAALRCAVQMILTRASRRGGNKAAPAAGGSFPGRWHPVELLEHRVMLSSTSMVVPSAAPPITIVGPVAIATNSPNANTPNATAPFTPSNITGAYGVNLISFNGTLGTGAGQTIAIIDAYNDPNIVSDVSYFNTHFNLPLFNTTGDPTFQVLNQNGQSSSLPSNVSASTGDWDTEECLDVEWAHSIAPGANIILFEANSASDSDLYTAVQTAADYSGVSVVSMSFGSSEFNGENTFDSDFTTPSGHQGVTFLASTGDSNAPAEYPAYSPNVLAVGGTSLTINSNGSWGGETAWGNVSSGSGGGGGVSVYESQPSYQTGNVNGLGGSSSPKRTAPDVSMLADPNTGVYMYSTWAEGANNGGYYIAGGTSLAAPMWAGLIAIADQGRALSGLGTLDGPSQTLPRLYQLPSSDFHDITGGNNGFAAGANYDLATGIGTPIANLLVPQLAGVNNTASKLVFGVAPSTTTAGATISPTITVKVEDSAGDVITTDTSNVTLAFGSNPGNGTLSGTTTVAAVNGVATFTGLSINKAATGYTLTASDSSLASATSGNFTINAAIASQVVFTRQPTGTTIETAISPSITVSIEDALGNTISSNASTIILTLSSGTFSTGSTTISIAAASGVATFSNLVINNAASYTLTASDGSLASAISTSFTVAQATPIVSVTDSGGTYKGTAFGATAASAVDPISSATIATFGSSALTFTYYAGTLTTAGQVAGATALGGAPSAAGAYTVVATYGASANYNTANSLPVNFSIAQRVLHVTATGQNKVYDGTNAATVNLSDDRVAGDSFSVTDTACTFASKNVASGVTITVTGLSLSGAAAANYTLSATTATTTANITALAITGSIVANSKVYDGTLGATLASKSLTGVALGDVVSLIGGTATFGTKDVGSGKTVTVTGLSLSGASAGNYSLANPTETTTANVTPLSIAASLTVPNKTYDGTDNATITGESLPGVLGLDNVTLSGGIATYNGQDVTVANTVTVTGLTLTGAQAGDYTLSNPTATLAGNIVPLGLTVIITAAGKTYDGTTAATLTGQNLAGIINSDDVSLSGGTAAFVTKDAGNAKTVTLSGLTLIGAQAADYSLTDPTPTTTATISPLAVTGSITAANKVYDGTTHATITNLALSGVLGADVVTFGGATATFDTKDVGNNKTVIATGLTLGGAAAADYSLSNPSETTTANVTPLSIAAGITLAGKTYDGTIDATITGQTPIGVVTGDDVSLTGGVATFNSPDVNSATTVTVNGLSLTGAQAGDYALSNPIPTISATIAPLPIAPTFTAADKSYDATTAAAITGESLIGVLGTDDVTLSGGTANFASKDAGNGKTVTLSGPVLSGAQAADYTLSNPNPTTTASVTPLSIVGSITAANRVYDGATDATITSLTLSGVIGADHVTLTGGAATFDTKDAGNNKTVTDSGLALSGAQAADYSLSNLAETTTANITPRAISATIAASGKVYDGTTAATITNETLTGVLGTDAVTLIGGSAAFNSKDVNLATNVTVTGLALSGAQAADYTLSNPNPSVAAHMTPLAISGNISAASKTYDGAASARITSQTLTGVLDSDSVLLSGGSAVFSSKDVGIGKTVTDSGLFLSGASAGDYSLSNPTETTAATITPLAITGNITANNKIYDGTDTATVAGESLNGVIAGDSVTLSGGVATFSSPSANNAATVSDTGLFLAGPAAADYVLLNPVETASAAIAPLGITGSITANNKVFDGATAATLATMTLNGVLAGDSVALTGGAATFNTSAVGNGKTVTATGLTLTGPQAGDYSLVNPTETASANITPLSISGSIVNDLNASGVMQAGDAGLASRTITLQVAGQGTKGQRTVKSDALGRFSFTGLAAGNYVLRITTPAGWHATTETVASLALQGGDDASGLFFGETNTASVRGSVFLDANGDGKRKSTEGGLAGWTVVLTSVANSTQTFIVTTDSTGSYVFPAVTPGKYHLSVIQQSNYVTTTKAPHYVALTLTANKAVTGENFGEETASAADARVLAKLRRR